MSLGAQVIPRWASRLFFCAALLAALWFLVEAGRASYLAGKEGKARPAASLAGDGGLTAKISANAGQAVFGNPLEKPTIPAKKVMIIEDGEGYYLDGQR